MPCHGSFLIGYLATILQREIRWTVKKVKTPYHVTSQATLITDLRVFGQYLIPQNYNSKHRIPLFVSKDESTCWHLSTCSFESCCHLSTSVQQDLTNNLGLSRLNEMPFACYYVQKKINYAPGTLFLLTLPIIFPVSATTCESVQPITWSDNPTKKFLVLLRWEKRRNEEIRFAKKLYSCALQTTHVIQTPNYKGFNVKGKKKKAIDLETDARRGVLQIFSFFRWRVGPVIFHRF